MHGCKLVPRQTLASTTWGPALVPVCLNAKRVTYVIAKTKTIFNTIYRIFLLILSRSLEMSRST